MSAGTRRLWTLLTVEAVLVLMTAPVGMAQESPYVDATANPLTVPVSGEVVEYAVEVVIADADLPATITALTSDLHGDITDPANPLLVSTSCAAPVAYVATPGWVGMACWYEVLVQGDPGDVTNTISVDVQLAGGSEVTLSDSVVVTISEALGAIRGTLIDSGTGLPIPSTYVWGGDPDTEGFSDSTGTFFFDGLEPGEYRLYSGNAEHGTSDVPPGYSSEYAYEWYEEEPVGVGGGFAAATPVVVLPGETTEIEWELTRGGAISGRVTSSDTGGAIADYDVWYWIIESGSASPMGVGGNFGGDVASDGTYRVFGLRAGDYIVCFESPYGSECWDDIPRTTIPPDQGDPVSVVLGLTITEIDAQFATEFGNGGNGGNGNGDTDATVLPFTGSGEPWLALTAAALVVAGAGALVASLRRTD